MSLPVTVALRAHNDMPLLEATLRALSSQTVPFNLIAFDNASTDGGRELLDSVAQCVYHVPEGQYVPGQVLNAAMRASSTPVVVFLNADCTPLDEHWLATLIAPFSDLRVGAAFSRQLPRPGCRPLAAHDTEAAFGDGSRHGSWRHCFSMASSAVRREAWLEIPFSETIAYSEDIAWSWQLRHINRTVRYVPVSRVYHSHNYTNAQWRRRQYGEGNAEASIFVWSGWQRSLLRYSLLPMARQMVRDIRFCVSTRQWSGLCDIPGYRFAQTTGRRQGLLDGLRTASHTSHAGPIPVKMQYTKKEA